jgi:hypothetical protein
MTTWKSFRPFTYRNTRTYQWRTDGGRWELTMAGQVVAKVVPDATHAGMWRIDLGDGVLSDMVNLPRAKDAAVPLADAKLNVRKSLSGGSPMRPNGRAVPTQPGASAHALDGGNYQGKNEQTDPAATLVPDAAENAQETV